MSEEDTKVVDIFDKDIENFGNDLEKMIEHLNIVIATHNKQVDEIERLNNIINELEKWFEDMNLESLSTFDEYDLGQYSAYKNVINKLQELKGSDKE